MGEELIQAGENCQKICLNSTLGAGQKEMLLASNRQGCDDAARILSDPPMGILPDGDRFFGSL
jgi:hypothetical protein